MWRLYPTSFPTLILTGFALAVLPLIFALVNNAISFNELANKSQRAVFNAVFATQNSRQLMEQINNMERSARQFSILNDPKIYGVWESGHRDFDETVRRMRGLILLREQEDILNRMSEAESRLFVAVAELRSAPKRVAVLADRYTELIELSQALDASGRGMVNQEMIAMQALSDEVHDFIYWQLLALVPVALFLVVGATLLILRPIRQIESALQNLGEGDFNKRVVVSGPKDLEAVGRQIDWLRMRLVELEEQKTRFLRQISHELKTPLSAIREGAELFEDGTVGALTTEQHEVAHILRQNALRLQRLIEDLLNYHTVQFQRAGLNLGRVELAPVLRRVAQAHRLPVRAKDIRLKVNCPAISFQADENKLELILDNLMSNAIRFSPPYGEVAVRASMHDQQVVIDVADQGPGIDDDERERVFDPFYQGKTQPAGAIKGTGLGLAIVREYVHAHGGRITIMEDNVAGAHFRVSLPVERTGVVHGA